GAGGPGGPMGPMGPMGPKGPMGPTGPAGPAGATAAGSGPTFLISGVAPTNAKWWTGTDSFYTYYTLTSSGEEPARGAPRPVACSLSTIVVYASTNRRNTFDTTDTITLTLVKNNSATSVACSATSTTNVHEAVSNTCTPATPLDLAVGDTLGLQWSHTNSSS